jgi:hypothetical protein
MLIVTTPEAERAAAAVRSSGDGTGNAKRCGTSDFEIGWGYANQVEIVGGDRWSRRRLLTAE